MCVCVCMSCEDFFYLLSKPYKCVQQQQQVLDGKYIIVVSVWFIFVLTRHCRILFIFVYTFRGVCVCRCVMYVSVVIIVHCVIWCVNHVRSNIYYGDACAATQCMAAGKQHG